MTKHMQICEIGAPHGGGGEEYIFPPTTVNCAENGTFWLSVKHKRKTAFYQKTLYFMDVPLPWKIQSICLLIQWTD